MNRLKLQALALCYEMQSINCYAQLNVLAVTDGDRANLSSEEKTELVDLALEMQIIDHVTRSTLPLVEVADEEVIGLLEVGAERAHKISNKLADIADKAQGLIFEHEFQAGPRLVAAAAQFGAAGLVKTAAGFKVVAAASVSVLRAAHSLVFNIHAS